MPSARAPVNKIKLENRLSLSNEAPSSSVVYPPPPCSPPGLPSCGGGGLDAKYLICVYYRFKLNS